jgi:hypothetical protein
MLFRRTVKIVIVTQYCAFGFKFILVGYCCYCRQQHVALTSMDAFDPTCRPNVAIFNSLLQQHHISTPKLHESHISQQNLSPDRLSPIYRPLHVVGLARRHDEQFSARVHHKSSSGETSSTLQMLPTICRRACLILLN